MMGWPRSLNNKVARYLLDSSYQPSLRSQTSLPHSSSAPPDQDGGYLSDSDRKNWLWKAVSVKDTYTSNEVKEQFNGPDTSSLTAFLLSLLSRSEPSLHSSHDPPASDLHELSVLPVASTSSPSSVSYYGQGSSSGTGYLPIENLQQESGRIERHCMVDSRDADIEDDESDWQLVTEDDLGSSDTSTSRMSQMVLPEMCDTSAILPESFRSFLYFALPTLVQGRQWVLLYSTSRHGMSLLTLYRRSAYLSGPCLLVAEDSRGAVFGGLLFSPLKPTSKKKYQGTKETFLFTNVLGKMSIFRPTGVNRYFILCTNDALAFGGGGCFGLHLDEELLHGSSGPCETFGNCCLAYSEEFILKNVELWGFAHTSKYVPRQASFKEPVEAPGVCRW